MTWQGYQTLDPFKIESQFSNEDALSEMGVILDELGEEEEALLDRVKDLMCHLPQREADFIDLYYFKRFKQTDIAKFFGVSQPTICYRLKRASLRIRFLISLPFIKDPIMKKELSVFFPDDRDVKILNLMYKTTCQSEVAKELDVSQGLIRHRFLRSIKKLGQIKDDESRSEDHRDLAEKYHGIFYSISQNLVILKEVSRSSDKERGREYILL